MEGTENNLNVEGPYPILFIPKVCTTFETNSGMLENVFIHLNIKSPDTEGNELVIYNGICNLNVVDGNDINIRYGSPNSLSSSENITVILAEANQITLPAYNESQIDPARSPYVYNRCEPPPLESCTITEGANNHIRTEQHNMYVTQNVYNCNEPKRYSPPDSDEQKLAKKVSEPVQNSDGYNLYEEDEFECGVFLSQSSEEIINEKETRARDERKFVGLHTDNEALKQLMSTDIQSVSRQQKTILFLGHDSQSEQTMQNISINDHLMECAETGEVDSKIVVQEDEFECGVFLSQSSEEIINEKETRARDERKFVGLHTDNEALKQLMSTDIQSVSRQQKTILFLGHDSQSEQTMQNISINDHLMECAETGEVDSKIVVEEDEFECGVFLSQSSEEIINEKETRARDERKFVGLHTDNEALKQLMSTDIQSVSRQQKTILFLGHDSQSEQTMQNISINDHLMECAETGEVDSKIVVDDCPTSTSNTRSKKYQCNKCKKIFDRLSAFKQHMVVSHRIYNPYDISGNVGYMCSDCGKNLKNQEKFEQHCLGYGDSDLECNKCHKVFGSKFTLRNHRKIHSRMFPCSHCVKSYSTADELCSHVAQAHDVYMCNSCSFSCNNTADLDLHQEEHNDKVKSLTKNSSESDFPLEIGSEIEIETKSDTSTPDEIVKSEEDHVQRADSVIALFGGKKNKKQRRYDKTCDVCLKKFDRISYLKRHLIEHVIQSTLAKNPVNNHGVLIIRCEICQEKEFTKIDRYKAHLREHAKLTLYKCTLCDKSFSDSSNFSKHKKYHGTTFFQCDICQRKFNSKKMITQHIEYHNKNNPLHCQYCDKVFHFKSMLNKHIKSSHVKESTCKFRCRFCRDYFRSLKEKWDHEWTVHNFRKVIVDCLICGSRFRKYAELKRHCTDKHDTDTPPAKR